MFSFLWRCSFKFSWFISSHSYPLIMERCSHNFPCSGITMVISSMSYIPITIKARIPKPYEFMSFWFSYGFLLFFIIFRIKFEVFKTNFRSILYIYNIQNK